MKLRITVHGNAYDVEVEVLDPGEGFPAAPLPRRPASMPVAPNAAPPVAPPAPRKPQPKVNGAAQGMVASPIAGTVLEIKCKAGDSVEKNQEVIIIEAMKMETSIAAPAAGTIKSVDVAVGDAVREGQTLVQFQ